MSSKVAYVTGSNSGVGSALVLALAKQGFNVWATMRTVAKGDALVESAKAAGLSELITIDQCDVSNDASVTESFERLYSKFDHIDVLINNAGYCVFGSVELLSMDAMKAQFETNFFGVIRTIKAVMPKMRAQRSGKIINISSVGGIWGQPFNDVYCASKFAVEGMGESQAALFREFGVYITNVEPGAIRTKFGANAQRPQNIPEDYQPHVASTIAVYTKGASNKGYSQSPEEVADIVVEKVVNVERPPFRLPTNPVIQGVFDMQLKDTTGEAGVAAGKARFLTPPATAEPTK